MCREESWSSESEISHFDGPETEGHGTPEIDWNMIMYLASSYTGAIKCPVYTQS